MKYVGSSSIKFQDILILYFDNLSDGVLRFDKWLKG